jgi:hypothetical protein
MATPAPANQSPYPQTKSILQNTGSSTVNRTGIGLSTMILIKVGNEPVGAIKSINIQENRNIDFIDETGTDGHIDSAPTRSTDISGSCERVRFDRLRITEAFSRGFLHVKSQRIPFDIEIIDQFNGEIGSGSEVVTVIENVWIESINYTYQADNWIISDTMNWKAETISSRIGDGEQPAAQGGERGIPLQYDPYELAADVGKRRGSMDAPGLISAAFLAS